ncbi:hypothetical protein LIER_06804 [Lithospermum erythrorhizon]|uniref:Uncharacterized protein n=1 Tax=Lithospermum erythrorhizon TaxID=34254 RepID=A0AAV3P5Q5_LITER
MVAFLLLLFLFSFDEVKAQENYSNSLSIDARQWQFCALYLEQKITWQSFNYPTDTLLPGQCLSADQQLFSRASESDYSRGIFRLKMKNDGNLCQYPIDTEDAWYHSNFSSFTDVLGNKVTLNLEANGNLYLFNSTHNIKKVTPREYPNSTTIYLMRLDVDGIFKVYSLSLDKGNWFKVWSSTDDGCPPKGHCGRNGFCALMDALPGFDYIHKGKESSGCERNFTAASCKAIDPTISYIMRRLENTVWENDRYASLKANTVEDCELFRDEECRKQRLPLRFGRRDEKDSNIALIKMGVPTSIGAQTPAGRTLSNSQKVVAVKKLENELADGKREFQTEMKVIGKTHHMYSWNTAK